MACRASRLQYKAITAQLVYTWRGARAVTSNGWHLSLTASDHQYAIEVQLETVASNSCDNYCD